MRGLYSFSILNNADGGEVIICCVSDGAGSAEYAREASSHTTSRTVELLSALLTDNVDIDEPSIYTIAETIYDELASMAEAKGVEINEYSCTFLGCVIYPDRSVFFQLGDGAIIRNDGSGYFTIIWWPQNGEYQNTTVFLIDDKNFGSLQVKILEETVDEVALLSDGLQSLVLSQQELSVHQPFFTNLFSFLGKADTPEKVNALNEQLAVYLSSDNINTRTDDDKTLFLASRLQRGTEGNN